MPGTADSPFTPFNLLLPDPSAPQRGYVLNAGGFQLPLFQAPPSQNGMPLSGDSLVAAGAPRVPCASVLVRIRKAPRSPSTGAVLDRSMVPSGRWSAVGLRDRPKAYATRLAYDSTRCLPFGAEVKLYPKRADLTSPTVRETLEHLRDKMLSREPETSHLPALPGSGTDADMAQWVNRAIGERPRAMLDYGYLAPFDPEAGLMLSVDAIVGAHRRPAGAAGPANSTAYAVLHSLAGPQGPILAREPLPPSGWHAARHPNWSSRPGVQGMQDGFSSYYSVRFDPKMCIFLQVRGVQMPASKEEQAAAAENPPAPAKVGWTILPVFDRRCEGYVRRGCFSLPLFVGDPPASLWTAIQDAPEVDSLIHRMTNVGRVATRDRPLLVHPEGLSLTVRLQDPQFQEMLEVPLGGRMGPSVELACEPLRRGLRTETIAALQALQQAAQESRDGSASSDGRALRGMLPDGVSDSQANKMLLKSLRTIVSRRLKVAARAV